MSSMAMPPSLTTMTSMFGYVCAATHDKHRAQFLTRLYVGV